jgi:hypothetical protein
MYTDIKLHLLPLLIWRLIIMQNLNPRGILTEKQRSDAVRMQAAGSSLRGIAASCGCTLRQLQQEIERHPQFAWQMEQAKEIIAAQAILQIIRSAATQPAAAKWLQNHLPEAAPLMDFVLTSLFPRALATNH